MRWSIGSSSEVGDTGHTRRACTLICLLSFIWSISIKAAPADNFIFGVGTHFAFDAARGYYPATQRPHLNELGVDSFRDDVNGDRVSPPTLRNPLGPRLGRLNEMLLDRSATPVLILRGDKLANEPKPRYVPTHPTEVQLFADHATRVVEATRTFAPLYEIWNEWNMEWRERAPFGGWLGLGRENPDFSPENYVRTAEVVYAAIKDANASATVLTGAIGDDPDWVWTRRALSAGLSKSGDGVSAHFYNHCAGPAGRTAETLIDKVEEFRIVLEKGGERRPIYITEFGWPNDDGHCGIALDLAAANIAQFTLWAGTTDWIQGIWVYELRDSGRDPSEPEHNFGLYRYNDTPKPAACAYREAVALSRRLEGEHFLPAPDGVRWLEGYQQTTKIWAFWTTERDSVARLTVASGSSAPLKTRSLCGGVVEIGKTAGISMMPIVIEAGDTSVASVTLSVSQLATGR